MANLIRAALRIAALAALSIAVTQVAAVADEPPAKPSPFESHDFDRPPGDPAAIARGKQVFSVNCAFCHGSDARGGEGGPNLLRSPIVLNDQKGEIIAAVVLNGRVEKGMPKFNLPMQSVADIAAYVHSIKVGAGGNFNPKMVLVGNAAAGKAYFNGKGRCTACHSVKKDLAGIGALDPKTLQDTIFTGGATGMLGIPSPTAPPRTVTVTLPTGEAIKGKLVSLDDFVVVLTDADGHRRTIQRAGDVPKVDIVNPLQAHLDMVRSWEDRDLRNVTAYLETVK
ncbi:MAG TPA: c-type cytochrome [Steroidobacteraceae bacterium]|nr:c-type cytochrome [Steroidobacteraceae bacterium]